MRFLEMAEEVEKDKTKTKARKRKRNKNKKNQPNDNQEIDEDKNINNQEIIESKPEVFDNNSKKLTNYNNNQASNDSTNKINEVIDDLFIKEDSINKSKLSNKTINFNSNKKEKHTDDFEPEAISCENSNKKKCDTEMNEECLLDEKNEIEVGQDNPTTLSLEETTIGVDDNNNKKDIGKEVSSCNEENDIEGSCSFKKEKKEKLELSSNGN